MIWWLGCAAEVDLHIRPVHGLRDLVAVAQPAVTSYRWTSDDGVQVSGPRVPADALWPGQHWRVEARTAGRTVGDAEYVVPEPIGGNVMVVVLDDVGVDKVSAYGDPTAPATPTLDRLASEGMRFAQAYANPVCSPSRAAILSGRHGGRTGVGWILDTGEQDVGLPLSAWTLPEAIRESRFAQAYADAAFGKWHLAGRRVPRAALHPNDSGFSWFAGTLTNPRVRDGWGYGRWEHVENGVMTEREGYLTTATVDDVVSHLSTQPEPWFAYVALHAAHVPWDVPPAHLLRAPLPPIPSAEQLYNAVLQAADRELGRLLDELGPDVLARTTVVVMGDNGTPSDAVSPGRDSDRQKHTVYEGGIHVPLIVTGPAVARPGEVSEALVHAVGVYPTVLELVGTPLSGPDDALMVQTPMGPRALDGRSWVPFLVDPSAPGAKLVYAESFTPNGTEARAESFRRMVRGPRFKLLRMGPDESFHDLWTGDPDGADLLSEPLSDESQRAYLTLRHALDELEDTIVVEGF